MIYVDDLSIAYFGNFLFSNANFTLQKGERLGFVGRNGSGKSTLIRLITKEETPDSGTITIKKNYSIGVLNQHLRFTKKTIIEEAALGLRPGEEDCIYKAETILFGLGFTEEDLDKSISSFSGGYQLRLHLAKVLISEPDCLLLDEPTNYLDIVSIRWLTLFLQKWQGEFILISHDREFMDSVTTHTMGIHRNKIRKIQGSTTDFYEKILQEEEIHEKTRVNLQKKRDHLQNFVDRFGAKATKAAQAQSRVKMLSRIPVLEQLKELHNLDFQFRLASFPGAKMLDVQGIKFSYNDQELIENLSLTIEKGERIAIVGKNGRGKSTILRLLAKDLIPLHGDVKHSDNLAIGYFGQTNIDRLHPKHTVEEEIANANTTLNRTEAMSIAGLMMFSNDQAKKKIEILSGGEKSRVLLGKILAKPCNLLLLDEPTHHLDMESIEALIDALEDFDGSVIIVTHSELILKRLALSKIIICHEGQQKLFLGDYETFLEKDGWHDGNDAPPASPKKPVAVAPVEKKMPSKSLQSLEKEITQLETLLARIEQQKQELHDTLVTAAEKNETALLNKASKELSEKESEGDLLQERLLTLYNQLE